MPSVLIEAPPTRGPRYGLFTAANGPRPLDERAVGSGVTYEPTSCGTSARTYPIDCPTGTPFIFDPADDMADFDAFLIYATLTCGRVGKTSPEMEAKVRSRLEASEQLAAETQMAALLAAGAVPLTAPDPNSLASVVGELEAWLYGVDGAALGSVGYIHAPVRVAAAAQEAGVIVKAGTVWASAMGTVWSFGGGYPDDGVLYASGTTNVWRSEDTTVIPAEETWDRETNQYYLVAQRTYVVGYDCAAASAVYTPAAVGS
jgi:hypothetical protein